MRRHVPFAALLALLVGAGPLWAQGKAKAPKKLPKRVLRKLAKVGKKLGVPAEALVAVGGERLLSRRPGDLRALLVTLHRRLDPRLLPLVTHLAQQPRLEPELRYAAVALIPAFALEGDRPAYLELRAVFKQLYRDEFQRVWELAAEGNHLLLGWFEVEREVVDLFERTYRAKHYRKAQRAYRAILDLRHPELRAGVAQEALREALDPRSRFGIKERSRAVRENGRRGAPLSVLELGRLLHKDGTVAVACADALAELGDPRALPALRKIGRTSAHVLRIPVLRARGRLQDATLLELVQPTFADDHVRIRAALIEALALLKHDKVDELLRRLDGVAQDEAVRRALDLVRLRRGDPEVVGRLREVMLEPDLGLARQILRIEHRVTDPLLIDLATSEVKELQGLRRSAVALAGARRLADPDLRAALVSLCEGDDKTALRLHAAGTLLQLGAEGARKQVQLALKDFAQIKRVDLKTGLGKARRFNGSHLGDVARRWARGRSWAALPLLSRWLDPPRPAAKQGEPPAEPERGGGTRTRGKGPAARQPRPPAKAPKFARHAFVRRTLVEALGDLVRDASAARAGKAQPGWPEAPEQLAAWSERGRAALGRALDDSHALVRRAAIRALARIDGHELLPGASLEEEAAALEVAEAVLAR